MSTASAVTWHTPPQIAEQLGIEPQKVRTWIQRGELVASNVADRVDGRPRWRVSASELEAFLARRQSRPPVKAARRRRVEPNVKQFF